MIKESKSYKLVNLQNRQDVMEEIAKTERDLKRMLGGQVALIAYVKEDDQKQRR
ncbi:hypothetical protein [Melghirimyces algeriensis]|uniref:Uncharacterized protein n=1 Tax=Melghirimyces algeriensis TaxID=910412 RepID=A0A521BQ54_9BACL|nr:hypothetical protein [Melghirimyces algeriensis]SMO49294.1 hypothetical protein SAMN06264849_102301 [Melghirimyces algeriensis]